MLVAADDLALLLDRDAQRTRRYSGVPGIALQDASLLIVVLHVNLLIGDTSRLRRNLEVRVVYL